MSASEAFLSSMALKISAAGCHALARELAHTARTHASRQGNQIPSCLSSTTCNYCGSVLVPGVTSQHRIKPVSPRRRRKLEKRKQKAFSSVATSSKKGHASTNHRNDLKRDFNELHSANNEMRISCNLCNRATNLPGSESIKKRRKNAKQKARGDVPLGNRGTGYQLGGHDRTAKVKQSTPSPSFLLLEPKRRRKPKKADDHRSKATYPGPGAFQIRRSQPSLMPRTGVERFLANIKKNGR